MSFHTRCCSEMHSSLKAKPQNLGILERVSEAALESGLVSSRGYLIVSFFDF